MEKVSCEGCNGLFKNGSSLKYHLRMSKNCPLSKAKVFRCEECDKTFARKSTLNRHQESCGVRENNSSPLEQENEELRRLVDAHDSQYRELEGIIVTLGEELSLKDESIRFLQEKVRSLETELLNQAKEFKLKEQLIAASTASQIHEKYAKKSSQTIYNINPKLVNIKCDTIEPFTEETIIKCIQTGKYTYNHFLNLEKGVVDFLKGVVIQDDEKSYACSDPSRNSFHRLIDTREWKSDSGAAFLKKVFTLLHPIAKKYQEEGDTTSGKKEDPLIMKDRQEASTPFVNALGNPHGSIGERSFNLVRKHMRDISSI